MALYCLYVCPPIILNTSNNSLLSLKLNLKTVGLSVGYAAVLGTAQRLVKSIPKFQWTL